MNSSEDDLWFLPGPPEDQAPTDLPWATAPVEPTADPAAWAKAERALARPLANAAQALGRLEGHLAHAPQGALDRLILEEIAGLLRLEGIWVGPERLALYRVGRLPRPEEAADLARADWAVRRRTGGPDPLKDLPGFLGARDGPETAAKATRWQDGLTALPACHPLTRAGFAHHLWRSLARESLSDLLEPLGLAARTLKTPHLALAAGGRAALVRSGNARGQLEAWLEAVTQGAHAAALTLNRLTDWRTRAAEKTGILSGRTPPHLIAALTTFPILSVESAAKATGSSPAACTRTLARFETMGLVREMTGQARFRFWEAAI